MFTRRIVAAAPGAAVVRCGVEDARISAAAVAADARGVIWFDAYDLVRVVPKALRLVLSPAGEPVVMRAGAKNGSAAALGPAVPEPPRRRVDLTEREVQVLRGREDGKSNAEIGRDLFVSEDTVKTHAHRLVPKPCARDRAHGCLGLPGGSCVVADRAEGLI